MSADDFRIHKEQQRTSVQVPPGTWTVVVTATPKTIHEHARCRTVNGARGRAGVELPAAPWVKPRSKEKPEQGDIGVAVIDEEGTPWIVGWKVQ